MCLTIVGTVRERRDGLRLWSHPTLGMPGLETRTTWKTDRPRPTMLTFGVRNYLFPLSRLGNSQAHAPTLPVALNGGILSRFLGIEGGGSQLVRSGTDDARVQ